MPWKDTVNAVLTRATGYHLTRGAAVTREQVRAETAAEAEARIKKATAELESEHARTLQEIEAERVRRREARRRARAEERIEAERRAADARERGEDLPHYFDDEQRRIVSQVRSRTMTDPPKLHGLLEATRYVVKQGIPGDIVECGVWRGGSMQAAALTLLAAGETDRHLHLFDTFEGMTEPTELDIQVSSGESAADLLETHGKDEQIWARATLDDVRAGMGETDYPQDRVHYHPGRVEETVPTEAPERIALLRLDTDWYESTKHEIEHLWDRLSPGGILIIDDFGDWEGARKATEEWLAATGEHLFLAPMGSGRVVVKPFD